MKDQDFEIIAVRRKTGIFQIEVNSRFITYANDRFREIFGYPKAKLENMPIRELYLDEKVAREKVVVKYPTSSGPPSPSVQLMPARLEYYLCLFTPKKVREHILGDLVEEYTSTILPKFGPERAQRWYQWQVFTTVCSYLKSRLLKVITFGWLVYKAEVMFRRFMN